MTYTQALQYLNSFFNLEKVSHFEYRRELNIKRMRMLAGWFSYPERKYPSILIGGTKGKGSTAVFFQSILQAAGFRVGLYTSPHLLDFRERIRINQSLISKQELTKLVSRIKHTLKKRRHEMKALEPVTFFEVSTLLAFLYFAEKKIDWAVLEVGMGGRLDATAIVNPVLSVMTQISLDHQEHLGNTIAKIAKDKSMIIRRNTPLVSAKQKPEADAVLQKRCRAVKVKGFFSGRDFKYQIRKSSLNGTTFDFTIKDSVILSEAKNQRSVYPSLQDDRQKHQNGIRNLKIRLPGDFQAENASVAVAGFLALQSAIASEAKQSTALDCFGTGLGAPRNDWEIIIRRGLLTADWPGRFEVINRKGRIFILDGAHNDASMSALVRNVRSFFPKREIQVIFGVSREKNLKPMFKFLSGMAKQIILTKSNQPRAQDVKVMMDAGMPYFHVMIPAGDIREALTYSNKIYEGNTVTLITGSLFLIAEARKILKS